MNRQVNSRQQLKQFILARLGDIAPEIDIASVDGEDDFREALDLDSMDFLTLLTSVSKQLGINIPEAHYSRITSLNAMVDYLYQSQRLSINSRPSS